MIKPSVAGAVSYLAIAGCTFGASTSFEFTVDAGKHERKSVPVRVPIPRSQIGGERIASATLTGPNGQSVAAQWTGPSLTANAAGELHFILSHLKAGESLRLKATLSTQPSASAPGFRWRDQAGHHADLLFGEQIGRESCRI